MNMKVTNILYSAVASLLLMAGVSSCEEMADYVAADKLSSAQVYFGSDESNVVDLNLAKSDTFFVVRRANTNGAVEIPLNITNKSKRVRVADKVTFEDGSAEGKIKIEYDPKAIVVNEYDTISISIGDESVKTPYGSSEIEIYVGLCENWKRLGIGGFYDYMFDQDGSFKSCVVEQSELDTHKYRVVNPYKGYFSSSESSKYFVFHLYSKGEQVTENFVAPFDGWGYFDELNSGYYYSDLESYIYPCNPFCMKGVTDDILALNGVKNFQKDGTPGLVSFTAKYFLREFEDGNKGFVYTEYDGAIKVLMPGYELADYSAAIEYVGRFYAADDKARAVVNVKLGADVNKAVAGVVAGKPSVEGILAAIANGTEIEASGSYKIPFPENAEAGKYYVYVVTYGADGETEEAFAVDQFNYAGEGGAVEETWTPASIGTWSYKTLFYSNDDGSLYEQAGLTLYQSDQVANHYKIAGLWDGKADFYFTVEEDGSLVFDPQSTNLKESADGEAFYIRNLGDSDGYVSGTYSKDEGVFSFNVIYYNSTRDYAGGTETFTLTGQASSEVAKRAIKKNNRRNRKVSTKIIATKAMLKKVVSAGR